MRATLILVLTLVASCNVIGSEGTAQLIVNNDAGVTIFDSKELGGYGIFRSLELLPESSSFLNKSTHNSSIHFFEAGDASLVFECSFKVTAKSRVPTMPKSIRVEMSFKFLGGEKYVAYASGSAKDGDCNIEISMKSHNKSLNTDASDAGAG